MYLDLYLDLTLVMVILDFMVNSICQRVKVAGYFGFEFGSSFSRFTLDSSHNSNLDLYFSLCGYAMEKEKRTSSHLWWMLKGEFSWKMITSIRIHQWVWICQCLGHLYDLDRIFFWVGKYIVVYVIWTPITLKPIFLHRNLLWMLSWFKQFLERDKATFTWAWK